MPKLAAFTHLTVEFFPCNFRGCVSEPVCHSTLRYRSCTSQVAAWPRGPSPAIPGPTSSWPSCCLHYPEALSLGVWAAGPVLFVLCWGRGVHTVAEHSRPEPSPEMIRRPDVFEDFKEGPAVLGDQSGLVSWVAVGRLGFHPQSWALPLPGPFPQLYDKGLSL